MKNLIGFPKITFRAGQIMKKGKYWLVDKIDNGTTQIKPWDSE